MALGLGVHTRQTTILYIVFVSTDTVYIHMRLAALLARRRSAGQANVFRSNDSEFSAIATSMPPRRRLGLAPLAAARLVLDLLQRGAGAAALFRLATRAARARVVADARQVARLGDRLGD